MVSKEERFTEVLDQYNPMIHKIVRSYCIDRNEYADLTQEIFLQLWRSFDAYDYRYARSTWLYRIALNVSISYYRKNKKRRRGRDHEEMIIANMYEQKTLYREEKIEDLYSFINELGEIEKAIMILYLEERSHAEIAEIIGISKSNVGTKINRIKKQMKIHFKNKIK